MITSEIEWDTLPDYRAKKAAKFYKKNRERLNDKTYIDEVTDFDGIIDVHILRANCSVSNGKGGYYYSQSKFLAFCALYFNTSVSEIKKYI